MTPDTWLAVLSRISPLEPDDLNAPAGKPGDVIGVWRDGLLPPSPRLWARSEPGWSYLGVRVAAPVEDPMRAALRLAAAALERGVVPVILSTLPQSGFERFGFRVERFGGGDAAEQARWEAEMMNFWDIAIIIDAGDLMRLG